MTRSEPRWTGVLLFLLAAACGRIEADPAGHFRGTLRSSCAPHDALSTALDLAAVKSEATLHLNLWPPYDAAPTAAMRFSEDGGGLGSFCASPGECQVAEWGEVRLESGATGISGSWVLGFADGTARSGTFDADWLLLQALCG